MKTYCYARVSTIRQIQGSSLEDQRATMLAKYPDGILYQDVFTGTKVQERPEFAKLIANIQAGDRLVVCKLDRLARSSMEGQRIIKTLLDNHIEIDILNMGLLNNSPVGKLTYQILLAFAEFERDMIYERTQTGRQIAMANGVKMGRKETYSPAQRDLVIKLKQQGYSYTEITNMTNIGRSSLQAILKQAGMVTPIGPRTKATEVTALAGVLEGMADSVSDQDTEEIAGKMDSLISMDKLSENELEALIKLASKQLESKRS